MRLVTLLLRWQNHGPMASDCVGVHSGRPVLREGMGEAQRRRVCVDSRRFRAFGIEPAMSPDQDRSDRRH